MLDSNHNKQIIMKITEEESFEVLKEFIPHLVELNKEISQAVDIIIEIASK